MRLRTVPFTIEVEPLAEGILNLFTEQEKVVLRFGMLPAEKMDSMKRMLTEKFTAMTLSPEPGRDDFTAIVKKLDGEGYDVIDFSLRELVSEALHEITCQLYRIGELVV